MKAVGAPEVNDRVGSWEFTRKSVATLLQLLHGLRHAKAYAPRFASGSFEDLSRRAKMLQRISAAILAHLRVEVLVEGSRPQKGLLVCNHVSFLDIMVLSSLQPVIFVSKLDVARWPIVGKIASASGTLFIEREKRSDVSRVNQQIQSVIDAGLLVCLFPEGTSSDGASVLPFKPSLLQPALSLQSPVVPGHIFYRDEAGQRLDSIAYFGDRNLMDCLRSLLARKHTEVRVHFGNPLLLSGDRKSAALHLHSAVTALAPQSACLDALGEAH
jgi:1-acyl-sn-glycerol-3-phosphate acyltransferase